MKYANYIILLLVVIACMVFNTAAIAKANEKNPILVLGEPGHFDQYAGEILKTEGFNEFKIEALTNESLLVSHLQQFDLVILTSATLTEQQAANLASYVKEGGDLIAFRPGEKIAHLFGIQKTKEAISNGYLLMDTASLITNGLLKETLQLHADADIYHLDGAKKIASLYKNAKEATGSPSVVLNSFGKGHAIAFLYNLPQSIAYTRQGNPMFAGQEKDGITGIRAMDLFTDGWVDTSKNTFNQADEQMRLLSHCIEYFLTGKKPLPRFWYFPDTLSCLVTLTNDGENSSEEDFEPQFKDIKAKGANMSLYILSTEKVSRKATDAWQSRGNEISGHPDDTRQAGHPDWDTMNLAFKTKLSELNTLYGISKMRTVVNHWFVWCGNLADGTADFTAQAKIESSFGVEMDINYARYDNKSSRPGFLGSMGEWQGNYTGSGMPMKFATADGATLDIYQHFNSVYDQQYMEHSDSIGFFNCFKGLVDRSLNNEEVYSYVCIKAHNNEYYFSKTALLEMIDYATKYHIPVWAPVKLLDFLKAKDEARFTNIQWSDDQLSFKIKSALEHTNMLACMLPYSFQSKKIKSISIDGKEQSYTVKRVKGSDYAFVTIKPGKDYNVIVKYND